jgi:hypothetical protein
MAERTTYTCDFCATEKTCAQGEKPDDRNRARWYRVRTNMLMPIPGEAAPAIKDETSRLVCSIKCVRAVATAALPTLIDQAADEAHGHPFQAELRIVPVILPPP